MEFPKSNAASCRINGWTTAAAEHLEMIDVLLEPHELIMG